MPTHAERAHAQHLLFSYWFGTRDPCPPQTISKQLYAERHGYRWLFEMLPLKNPIVRGEESPRLAEMVWHKVVAMRRLFANDKSVARLTFVDSDTLMVRPQRTLESIFAQKHAHDGAGAANCSVYLQADPYLLNAGFLSVRRTRWVLKNFLPTWFRYTEDPRFYFRRGARDNFHEPEQAALVATTLHYALRALAPEHELCLANATERACTDPKLSAEHHAKALAYFAERKDLPEAPLRAGGLTFQAYMAKLRRPSHRLYSCAAYLYRAALGLSFSSSTTIRVDAENAICLLGYTGPQINRHHMLPVWFLAKVANGSLGKPSLGLNSYGPGYSRDLLLVHQKGLPEAMCRPEWLPPQLPF